MKTLGLIESNAVSLMLSYVSLTLNNKTNDNFTFLLRSCNLIPLIQHNIQISQVTVSSRLDLNTIRFSINSQNYQCGEC